MTIKDRIYAALFAVSSFLIFLPQYTSAKLIAWLDMAYYFLPFRMLTGELVKSGVVPLWNPYIYCGNPLLANMQSAVFYPLSVFYYVFSPVLAAKLTIFIAFFIAAFSFYSFLRLYKLSEESSFLGGFLFAFTIYMAIKAVEMADFHTMIWAPAILYFVKKYSGSGKNTGIFFTALTLMMSFLGGHLQVFLYVYMLFAAYYFFENINAGGKGLLARFAAINAVFLAFTCIQALPTLEFISMSRRILPEGMGYSSYMGGFPGLEQLAQTVFPFIVPYLSATTSFLNWMGLIDIGILALFIAGLGAVKMDGNRYRLFLLSVFGVSFVCSYMGYLPFFKFIYDHVFFLKMIRYPGKINFIYFFALCVFAAHGFETLFDASKKPPKKFGIVAVCFWAAVFAVYMFMDQGRGMLLKFYRQRFAPLISLDDFVDLSLNYDFFIKHFLVYLMMLTGVVILIYAVSVRDARGRAMKYVLLASAVLCAIAYQWGTMTLYGDFKDIAGRTKTVDFLLKAPDISRTRLLAPLILDALKNKPRADSNEGALYFERDSLAPNIAMTHHIYNADGFDSLALANFFEFKGALSLIEMPWENPAFPLLNAGYIAAVPRLGGRFIELECRGLTNIYKFTKPSGQAFFVPARPGSMVFEDTRGHALDYITGKGFDLYRQVVFNKKDSGYLDGLAASGGAGSGSAAASIDFARKNTNEIDIKTGTGAGGILVVSDAYCRGWRAYVDGAEERITEADGMFKSLYLKAGKHEIIFKYLPFPFVAGAIVSFLSMLLLAAGLFFKFALFAAPKKGGDHA